MSLLTVDGSMVRHRSTNLRFPQSYMRLKTRTSLFALGRAHLRRQGCGLCARESRIWRGGVFRFQSMQSMCRVQKFVQHKYSGEAPHCCVVENEVSPTTDRGLEGLDVLGHQLDKSLSPPFWRTVGPRRWRRRRTIRREGAACEPYRTVGAEEIPKSLRHMKNYSSASGLESSGRQMRLWLWLPTDTRELSGMSTHGDSIIIYMSSEDDQLPSAPMVSLPMHEMGDVGRDGDDGSRVMSETRAEPVAGDEVERVQTCGGIFRACCPVVKDGFAQRRLPQYVSTHTCKIACEILARHGRQMVADFRLDVQYGLHNLDTLMRSMCTHERRDQTVPSSATRRQ